MDRQFEMAMFLAVVDHGSFSAVARSMGQTPSAIGKRVRLLEERLGVDLLIRSTRRMALSEAGQRYSEEAREILARVTALEEDITDGADHLRGTVRLTAPTAYGQRYVVPVITDFLRTHTGVEVDLLLTDKRIDLVSEGIDLAIRTGVVADSTLIARRLGAYRRTICVSPDYLATHGAPEGPADLGLRRCLKLPHERTPVDWGLESAERVGTRRLGAGFICNSLDALHRACLEGEGIACLPDFLAQDSIRQGRLTAVLQDHRDPTTTGDILIIRPETSLTPRRVRTLIEALVAQLRNAD